MGQGGRGGRPKWARLRPFSPSRAQVSCLLHFADDEESVHPQLSSYSRSVSGRTRRWMNTRFVHVQRLSSCSERSRDYLMSCYGHSGRSWTSVLIFGYSQRQWLRGRTMTYYSILTIDNGTDNKLIRNGEIDDAMLGWRSWCVPRTCSPHRIRARCEG